MDHVATIEFRDASTSEAGAAIVRGDAEVVALALTLQNDGDLEVVLTKTDARRLVDALSRACG